MEPNNTEINSEAQCSVEINRSQKGEYTYKVKVYCDDVKVMAEKLEEYCFIGETRTRALRDFRHG